MNLEYEIVRFFSRLEPWHWAAFGLLLLVAEMVVPAFVLLWFGAAALVVAAVYGFVDPNMAWETQLMLWAILSVVSVGAWHTHRMLSAQGVGWDTVSGLNRRADGLVGKVYVLAEPMVGLRGTLKVGDTIWRVEAHEPDLPAGTRVEITTAVGTLLHVRPVPPAQDPPMDDVL
jgi:inner membrane protein